LKESQTWVDVYNNQLLPSTTAFFVVRPITANFFHQLCFNLKIKWNEVTDQLLIFFHISVTGIPPKEHALPNKQSEF
jgi:hypothetical protein